MQRRFRIVLTDVCNFRCPCCYNEGNHTKNTPQEVDCEQILRFASKLNGYIEHVVLTGGEPLLYSRFAELVLGLNKLGIKMQLTTNGSLLQKLLAQRRVLQAIDRINVSLDKYSPTNFRYKTYTSSNVFDLVIHNIKDVAAQHKNVTINTVYDDQVTCAEIQALIQFCGESSVKNLKFIPLLDVQEDKFTNRLENILHEIAPNAPLLSNNSHYLIKTYNINETNVSVLHQYCNNSCAVCRKESFIRINCDNKINFCRRRPDDVLSVCNLLPMPRNKIIDILEGKMQSEK